MSVTFDATPGSPTGNSFTTVEAAQNYIDTRVHSEAWDLIDDKEKALMSATRTISKVLQARRAYTAGPPAGYWIRPTWTGFVATTTQVLPWPRIGMYDENGNEIPVDVYPTALQEATAEMALQSAEEDRTLDSDVQVTGLKKMKAGPVAMEFKDGQIESVVLPQAVWDLLVPSWYTDQIFEGLESASLEVYI